MGEVTHIERTGIVEAVKAMRKDNKDVKYLAVNVRFETELKGTYYNEDIKIDSVDLSVSPLSGVNPGDVVAMTIDITNPLGQRFVPALEVSTNEGS